MRIGKLNCVASINPKQGIDTTEHSSNQNQKCIRKLDNVSSTTFMQCPQTIIFIEKIEVNSLIDTGSQISCISQQFFNNNLEILKHCPTLPLQDFQAIGFNGKKSDKITKQIYAETQIESRSRPLTFIIIPNLIRPCILGIDSLSAFGIVIDTKTNSYKLINLIPKSISKN